MYMYCIYILSLFFLSTESDQQGWHFSHLTVISVGMSSNKYNQLL